MDRDGPFDEKKSRGNFLGMSRTPFLVGIASLFVASTAFSHVRIKSPTPRDTGDGHKFGPCGRAGNVAGGAAIPKGAVTKVYPAGTTTIPVEWEETVAHGGWFAIDLSTTGDDKNFTMIDMVKDPAGISSNIGAPRMVPIPPGTTCKNCTLRVRQVMCSSDAIPLNDAKCTASSTTISTYFTCADIQILGAGEDAGPPPPDAGQATTDSGTGTTTDSGTSSGTDSGSSNNNNNNGTGEEEPDGDFNSSSGCSTTASVGWNGLALSGVAGFVAMMFRRRRRN